MVFRARYERKKISTQEDRYTVALEDAEKEERKKLTLDELQAKALDYFDKFYNPDSNKIDVDDLATTVKREILGFDMGHNKAYRLAKQIRYDHPKLFEIEPAIHKDNADKVS